MAYLEVQLPQGVRGGLPIADSLTARGGLPVADSLAVQIIRGEENYPFHYQLGDTLNLYGDFNPEDLQLFYDPNQNLYFLQLQDKTYLLEKPDKITPLIPE